LLRIQQRDGEDVYDPSNFTLSGFVKFCAFATQFIELLKCGLETFNAPTYQQFAKRIGRLVSQTVQVFLTFEITRQKRKVTRQKLIAVC